MTNIKDSINDLKAKLNSVKILDHSSFEDILINVLKTHAPGNL